MIARLLLSVPAPRALAFGVRSALGGRGGAAAGRRRGGA